MKNYQFSNKWDKMHKYFKLVGSTKGWMIGWAWAGFVLCRVLWSGPHFLWCFGWGFLLLWC